MSCWNSYNLSLVRNISSNCASSHRKLMHQSLWIKSIGWPIWSVSSKCATLTKIYCTLRKFWKKSRPNPRKNKHGKKSLKPSKTELERITIILMSEENKTRRSFSSSKSSAVPALNRFWGPCRTAKNSRSSFWFFRRAMIKYKDCLKN